MFNMLGVIEPMKEKKKPKIKRENSIINKKILMIKITLKNKLYKKTHQIN
tara:strand:- start:129 stop:278 length:150 start_codon:yes stop_codon:yes gene_type:complete